MSGTVISVIFALSLPRAMASGDPTPSSTVEAASTVGQSSSVGQSSTATAPEVTMLGAVTSLAAGETGALEFTIQVPNGFHVYRDMVHVSVTDPAALVLGEANLPPGLSSPDPADPTATREQYDFDAIVQIPLLQPAAIGAHTAAVDVRYQACHGGVCLMPRTVPVQVSLVVTEE